MAGRVEMIAEVAIDETGALHIKPTTPDPFFEYVYRAGTQISWRPGAGSFATPPPQEWSYWQWFDQVIRAVDGELGVQLILGPTTRWDGVSSEIRTSLEASP